MNSSHARLLSCALLSSALFLPQLARAASPARPASNPAEDSTAGTSEAMKMVPAQAVLSKDLDARKAHQGEQFRAKLYGAARLSDGTELPSGTELLGTVAADNTQPDNVKMVLRISKAQFKGGRVLPIKATIVGLYAPANFDASGTPINPEDQATNTWNRHTTQIDEIGVLSGVDLHSSVASNNSGTLESQKKKDFHVLAGSEIALAIAPRQSGQ